MFGILLTIYIFVILFFAVKAIRSRRSFPEITNKEFDYPAGISSEDRFWIQDMLSSVGIDIPNPTFYDAITDCVSSDFVTANQLRQFKTRSDGIKVKAFKNKVIEQSRRPIYNETVRYDYQSGNYQLADGRRISKEVFEDLDARAMIDLEEVFEFGYENAVTYYGIPANTFRSSPPHNSWIKTERV